MLSENKIGTIVKDEYGKSQMIATKQLLIEYIFQLEVGKRLDWAEFDVLTGETTTTYAVERIEWCDSSIILIGGYGGEVSSCYLYETINIKSEEDAENIVSMVNYFFENIRFISENELIYISIT